jgi:DNA (cytosine-5)-methyltransferase 1
MLRAIREIQPQWIVGENVFGFVNWSGGLVFDQVQADLEAEGYEVQPYVLPACAVNAPHRRDRVWIVAHNTMRIRTSEVDGWKKYQQNNGNKFWPKSGTNGFKWFITDTHDTGYQRDREQSFTEREKSLGSRPGRWDNFPTQSPLRGRNDGLSDRLVGITFPKWRNESIKAMGNAIVPQVAYQIFKAIEQYNNQ